MNTFGDRDQDDSSIDIAGDVHIALGNALSIILIGLVLFSLALAWLHHSFWCYGIDKDNIPASFFDLDSESTIASWFASMQWFSIALSSFIVYFLEGLSARRYPERFRYRFWWLVTALVFLVASADEIAMIHETAGELLGPWFMTRGIGGGIWSYFRESPWLVFYALPLSGFILFTLWFLSDRLKQVTKSLYLCASGYAFFIFALVIEFVQGLPAEKLLPLAITFQTTCARFYAGSVLVEETLENLGSAFVLVSFLTYCRYLLGAIGSVSKRAPEQEPNEVPGE